MNVSVFQKWSDTDAYSVGRLRVGGGCPSGCLDELTESDFMHKLAKSKVSYSF